MDKLLKSRMHLKVVKFFHENQGSVDTPRGIATWIGEDRLKVRQALEDLVEAKIIIADRATSTTGYCYTRDDKIIKKIDKFLKMNR